MNMIDSSSALIRLHEIQFSSDKRLTPEQYTRRKVEIERCISELSPELTNRYKILLKRYGKTALSPMNNKVCLGCFISQPTSSKPIEGEIYACSHCGRLLIDENEMVSIDSGR